MWKWVILIFFLGSASTAMQHRPTGLIADIIEVSCDIGILLAVLQIYREFKLNRARKRAVTQNPKKGEKGQTDE